MANGTTVMLDGDKRGLFYFEVRLDALRAQVLARDGDATMRAVTERTELVVIDSRSTQVSATDFGQTEDSTFSGELRNFGTSGLTTIGDERVAYVRMEPSETLQIVNDNDWFITASDPVVVTGLAAAVSPALIALLALGIPLLAYALVSYARLIRRNRTRALETTCRA